MDISLTKQNLQSTLLQQNFEESFDEEKLILMYKQMAEGYVKIDNSIAVLSDFAKDKSYIYMGDLGHIFGLSLFNKTSIDSAFEDCIFQRIHPDDLIQRHILELRYFQFQNNTPKEDRNKYNTQCLIRILDLENNYRYIVHKTYYLDSLPNGSTWLALCLYSIDTEPHLQDGINGKIINNATGAIIPLNEYSRYDKTILSRRELDVLKLVAQGDGSKQIAEKLNIAVYTVYRHRQNIIQKLKVANAAEAVKTAFAMKIINV